MFHFVEKCLKYLKITFSDLIFYYFPKNFHKFKNYFVKFPIFSNFVRARS